MEYRLLGDSGFAVPALSFGAATFGTDNQSGLGLWGNADSAKARRLIDCCVDAGAILFDTADTYSWGRSEEVLGEALRGRRGQVQIATKAHGRMSDEPNALGTSRYHLISACEASLRRLQTDYIDIYTLHGFDARTSIEETLRALETLVQSGKVRYIACSNFSGWHLMKSLAISAQRGWARYVAHQAYYSLLGREYEWELLPLAVDQRVSTIVWGPLAQGLLSGKYRRGQPPPTGTRVTLGASAIPAVDESRLYRTVDALETISAETGKTVAQVALNWLLQRPTVASVIIGARDEAQLRENLGAVGWNLSAEHVARLDTASETRSIYPYWHQREYAERNPTPTT